MGFGAFLVTFCASKKLPGVWGREGPEGTSSWEGEGRFVPTRPAKGESALRGRGGPETPHPHERRNISLPRPRRGREEQEEHHV